MRHGIAFLLSLSLLTMSSCKAPTSAVGAADPTIAEALAEVSIDSVKVYIDDLVALHTRHTLSTQADPERGIGAAVDYLAARCRQWAETADQQRPRPIVEKVYYAAGGMGELETVRILSGIPLQQTVKCLFVSG